MKKITALFLIICMALTVTAFAEENDKPRVYIFGDDWAKAWGDDLRGFFCNEEDIINAAGDGELLSGLTKKTEYQSVGRGDIVILSYGILEKDRPGDKNVDFKKNIETVVDSLNKKGAEVIFVSIASSMRYNTMTGKMEETKNFYTETTRALAKSKGIKYIDLASLTAAWANRLGSFGVSALYSAPLSLTDAGNRMCAYEVFKTLYANPRLDGMLQINLKRDYSVAAGETGKVIDVFFESEFAQSFAVYIKGGAGVWVNSDPVPDGDITYITDAPGGKIDIKFSLCEKIQVAPVYRFEANGFGTTENAYKGEVYPGVYNVTVQKSEPLKASVYLNGYLIASNLDMPGTQIVTEAAEHTFRQFHLDKGSFEVKVEGLTDKLEYISFCESATIYGERTRIFVGGDSTVCNYYPLLRTGEEADGTVMTGWAMLLEKYVDADVINLAASGDWASKWKKSSFGIIEKEGKKGDIFIIQFGINDRYNTTLEDMTGALGEMIDVSAQKGMIPILVSPQISAGYGWGDESNTGKSDGGDYQEFFDAVRRLAEEKGCFYVDLTDMSSGWFSEVGRENVYKKYHLWDYENDRPGDTMHLSYKGADAMCRFFVMTVDKISSTQQTDKWGNSLTLLKIW